MNYWINHRERNSNMTNSIYKLYEDSQMRRWENDKSLDGLNKYFKHTVGALKDNQQKAFAASPPKDDLEVIMHRVFNETIKEVYSNRNPAFNRMISFQTMSEPVGKVNFLRFRYASHQSGNSRGADSLDLVYGESKNAPLPEVNLVIEQEEITAKTRILPLVFPLVKKVDGCTENLDPYRGTHFFLSADYTRWCDANSYQDRQKETTMVNYLSEHMNKIIVQEITKDLRNNAGTKAFMLQDDPTIKPGEQYRGRELGEAIFCKMVEMSSVIHRKTLRGGANWLFMHPETADKCYFQTTGGHFGAPYKYGLDGNRMSYVGTVCNRWGVYTADFYPKNEILMGYKGDSYMDAGYFYNGFVPFCPMPVVVNGVESYGISTRYSKKLLREGTKFYGRLIFTDVEGGE